MSASAQLLAPESSFHISLTSSMGLCVGLQRLCSLLMASLTVCWMIGSGEVRSKLATDALFPVDGADCWQSKTFLHF